VRRGWIAGFTLCCALAAWAADPVAEPDREVGAEPDREVGAESPIEWSFTGEVTLRPDRVSGEPGLYDRLNTSLLYRYRFLRLVGDLSLALDERYAPDEPYMLGRSFYLENGGVILDFDFLSFSAGRFVHRDTVDTPYSLFISAADPWGTGWASGLPALLADLTIRGGCFSYESRWIRLNSNSIQPLVEGGPTPYPDRGANYKVFAVELGKWRFGLQDAAVYYDRVFDAEYFLSPIPHILTQMVTKRDSTPWQEDANDNSLMGLFAEWRPAHGYLYAQWLVDDISLDFLIPWFLRDLFGDRGIANKWAWSVGGHWDLPFGRLGFYHAGATKYTFAATEDGKPYEYTYYPAVEYSLDDDPAFEMTLDYRDNYLGYKYGENNLAFRLELSHLPRPLLGADFRAALEYVLSGSKSPANPWHEYATAGDAGRYTQMLDEPVLEHTVVGDLAAAWPWRGWTFYTRLKLGGVFNRLGLEPAEAATKAQIFRPQAGENAFLYAWTLGFTYRTGRRQSRSTAAPSASSNQPPEAR